MTLLLCLVTVLVLLVAFYVGIIVGVKDCKRTFGIPTGAVGVDDNGYVYR